MKKLVYLVCPSNSGKTSICDALQEEGWGSVGVGKVFRSRYPMSHFQGQDQPTKTRAEAWEIYLEELDRCWDKDHIIIDGQPRDIGNVQHLIHGDDQVKGDLVANIPKLFLYIDVPISVRFGRFLGRYQKSLDTRAVRLIEPLSQDPDLPLRTITECCAEACVYMTPDDQSALWRNVNDLKSTSAVWLRLCALGQAQAVIDGVGTIKQVANRIKGVTNDFTS